MFDQDDAGQPIEAQVARVEAQLRRVVERLDPDEIPGSNATALYERFDQLVRMATAGRTLIARRVEAARAWQGTEHHSAAELLAAVTGSSLGAAKTELETSAVLGELPDVRAGLQAGTLSPSQGAVIADAAKADPAAAARLIDAAGRSNLTELRQEAGRVKAAADRDAAATHERIRRARRCSRFTETDGTWVLMARGAAEAGSIVSSALDAIIDELSRAGSGDARESRDALAFDALVELARRVTDGSAGTKKQNPRYLGLLRVDAGALQRGSVGDGELCEITGVGPVPVQTARELLGEAVLKLVITRGVDVANVTHLGRGPNAAQKVALAWRSPHCSVEGCSRTHLEWDHRIDFAQTRHTRLDELDGLCDPHHDQKTRAGWALVPGVGKRAFVPPDDPRHPGRGAGGATGPPRNDPADTTRRIQTKARQIAVQLALS